MESDIGVHLNVWKMGFSWPNEAPPFFTCFCMEFVANLPPFVAHPPPPPPLPNKFEEIWGP